MKKFFLFAMTAATMLFTACSSDDNAAVNEEGGVQRIVFSVENSGQNTRAGRDLKSSEAKQTIENVKAIIVDATTHKILKVKDFAAWSTTAEDYTTGGHGKKQEWVLEGGERLAAGTYRVYAFGYHTGTQYTDLATKLAALTVGSDYENNLFVNTTEVTAEEIFGGRQEFTLSNDNGSLSTQVVLHRQVAGVFVYAKEIPYVAGAAKLSLYASDNNKTLAIYDFDPVNGNQLVNNGGNDNSKYINGGSSAGATTLIASAPLTDWFTTIAEDANHLVDATNWISTGHTHLADGSVFLGKFIIPFLKRGSEQTFVLKLEDASSNELRKWNIKLPSGDALTTASTIHVWNGTDAFNNNTTYTETVNTYSVWRNHLYGVGKKLKDDTTGGEDPSDPGDDDNPQTLNTKQDIILMVNDNWEVLHEMVIE